MWLCGHEHLYYYPRDLRIIITKTVVPTLRNSVNVPTHKEILNNQVSREISFTAEYKQINESCLLKIKPHIKLTVTTECKIS